MALLKKSLKLTEKTLNFEKFQKKGISAENLKIYLESQLKRNSLQFQHSFHSHYPELVKLSAFNPHNSDL